MQPADFQRFKALMTGIAKLYERELDGLVLDAYWVALRTWSVEDFEAACGQLMRTSKFMPRPADFEELRKAGRATAGEAWILAYESAKGKWACEIGANFSCGDPVADRAMRALGGYRVLAECETTRLSFLEKRFAEHYAAMQEADEVREAVPQIAFPGHPALVGPQSIQQLLSGKPPQ